MNSFRLKQVLAVKKEVETPKQKKANEIKRAEAKVPPLAKQTAVRQLKNIQDTELKMEDDTKSQAVILNENSIQNVLIRAIRQYALHVNSQEKFATFPSAISGYLNKVMQKKHDSELFLLAIEMMEKGPDLLKLCVAGNFPRLMDDHYLTIFNYVNDAKKTYVEMEAYAKSDAGKAIVEDAMNFVGSMIDLSGHRSQKSF